MYYLLSSLFALLSIITPTDIQQLPMQEISWRIIPYYDFNGNGMYDLDENVGHLFSSTYVESTYTFWEEPLRGETYTFDMFGVPNSLTKMSVIANRPDLPEYWEHDYRSDLKLSYNMGIPAAIYTAKDGVYSGNEVLDLTDTLADDIYQIKFTFAGSPLPPNLEQNLRARFIAPCTGINVCDYTVRSNNFINWIGGTFQGYTLTVLSPEEDSVWKVNCNEERTEFEVTEQFVTINYQYCSENKVYIPFIKTIEPESGEQ